MVSNRKRVKLRRKHKKTWSEINKLLTSHRKYGVLYALKYKYNNNKKYTPKTAA